MDAAVMQVSDPTEPHTSSTVDQSVAGLLLHAIERESYVFAQ